MGFEHRPWSESFVLTIYTSEYRGGGNILQDIIWAKKTELCGISSPMLGVRGFKDTNGS
jgi:hypothetical protein